MPERFSLGSLTLASVALVLLYCFRTIHLRVLGHFVAPARGVFGEPYSELILEGERTMRIGMLTGGGYCPGLNAVIRAVVRKGVFHYQDEFVGFMEGWRGLIEDKSMVLDLAAVGGILPRGGT